MRIFRSARRRRSTLLVLVGLGVVVLQSDLVALSSDSATYGNFDLGSGTFTPTPPAAHRAEVAQRTGESSCGTYSDEVTFGPFNDGFDLDTGTSTMDAYDDVCARNGGNVNADLYVSFDPATFLAVEEDGGCAPGELEAGDAFCSGSFEDGELDDILFLRLTSIALSSTSCTVFPGTVIDVPFDTAATTPVKLADDLVPGDECAFDFQPVFRPDVTEEQKLAAQTDQIQWSLVFTVQDA